MGYDKRFGTVFLFSLIFAAGCGLIDNLTGDDSGGNNAALKPSCADDDLDCLIEALVVYEAPADATLPSAENLPDPAVFTYLRTWRGHSYAVISSYSTRANAKATAEQHGAYLVEIDDSEENQFLLEVQSIGALNAASWIGLSELDLEGVWTWESGAADDFVNWAAGQPVSGGTNDDCASFSNGDWSASNCDSTRPAIVEWDEPYLAFDSLVFYGRIAEYGTLNLTCPEDMLFTHILENDYEVNNCDARACNAASYYCSGEAACTFSATNEECGGDPCVNQQKHLDYLYVCSAEPVQNYNIDDSGQISSGGVPVVGQPIRLVYVQRERLSVSSSASRPRVSEAPSEIAITPQAPLPSADISVESTCEPLLCYSFCVRGDLSDCGQAMACGSPGGYPIGKPGLTPASIVPKNYKFPQRLGFIDGFGTNGAVSYSLAVQPAAPTNCDEEDDPEDLLEQLTDETLTLEIEVGEIEVIEAEVELYTDAFIDEFGDPYETDDTDDSGDGGDDGTTDNSNYYDGSEYCVLAMNCSQCSISACASNSCQGWYETSDGRIFECGGCASACSAPADAVLRACCPEYFQY